MKPQHDPMARPTCDDSPLFGKPRDAATPKPAAATQTGPTRPAHRPMAQTSLAANQHVDRASDYLGILSWLNGRRVDGGTHGEWCDQFDRDSSSSGRFTELAAAELIAGIPGDTRRTETRRAGQVYRVTVRGTDALRAGAVAVMNAVREAKKREQTKRKAS